MRLQIDVMKFIDLNMMQCNGLQVYNLPQYSDMMLPLQKGEEHRNKVSRT